MIMDEQPHKITMQEVVRSRSADNRDLVNYYTQEIAKLRSKLDGQTAEERRELVARIARKRAALDRLLQEIET